MFRFNSKFNPESFRDLIFDLTVIIKEQELIEVLDKKRGQRIVFASGVFDLFHTGHLGYLEQAKKQGDILVVWVNSDQTAAKLDKSHALILPFYDRAKLVDALKPVDYVIEFKDESPERILKKFKPDVVARSGQPQINNPMHKLAESMNIKMFYCQTTNGLSTTNLIKRVKNLIEN